MRKFSQYLRLKKDLNYFPLGTIGFCENFGGKFSFEFEHQMKIFP